MTTTTAKQNGGGVPAWFVRYANETREAIALKMQAEGRETQKTCPSTANWWNHLDLNTAKSLLRFVGVNTNDDLTRYTNSRWESLPEKLRDSVGRHVRLLKRQLAGCHWYA